MLGAYFWSLYFRYVFFLSPVATRCRFDSRLFLAILLVSHLRHGAATVLIFLRSMSLIFASSSTAVAEQRYDAPCSAIEDILLEGEAFCIKYAMWQVLMALRGCASVHARPTRPSACSAHTGASQSSTFVGFGFSLSSTTHSARDLQPHNTQLWCATWLEYLASTCCSSATLLSVSHYVVVSELQMSPARPRAFNSIFG